MAAHAITFLGPNLDIAAPAAGPRTPSINQNIENAPATVVLAQPNWAHMTGRNTPNVYTWLPAWER